jgi:hypothetical protein
MSAAAAPELRIVPPDPPLPAAATQPADPAAHARHMAQARAVGTAMCVTGALLPVPCVAAQPYLGEAVWVGIVFSWVFLLPVGGLTLFVAAVRLRTRAGLRAMLLVAAAFVASLPLLKGAGRVGQEAWVSSHAAEMEALAVRYRTEGVEPPKDGTEPEANLALLREMRAYGYQAVVMVDGGTVFRSGQLFGADLLYADGGKAGADGWTCSHPRPIGGRWFLVRCSTGNRDYGW